MGKPRRKWVVRIIAALVVTIVTLWWLHFNGVILAGPLGYANRVQHEGLAKVIRDGRVAVGLRPGILQLNDEKGNLIWRKRLPGCSEWITGVDCATDGTLYAFSWDGALYSLDKEGRLNWRELLHPPYYDFGPGDHSCADTIHGGEPVVLSDERILLVIRSDG